MTGLVPLRAPPRRCHPTRAHWRVTRLTRRQHVAAWLRDRSFDEGLAGVAVALAMVMVVRGVVSALWAALSWAVLS